MPWLFKLRGILKAQHKFADPSNKFKDLGSNVNGVCV